MAGVKPAKDDDKAADRSELDANNIIPVTEDDVNDEPKKLIHDAIAEFKRTCLQSFSALTGGKVVPRTPLPTPCQITIAEDTAKFQDRIDEAIHHALINQSNVLKNLIQNVIYQMMNG